MKKFLRILAWFFSVVYLLSGLIGLLEGEILSVLLLGMGVSIFPLFVDKLELKTKKRWPLVRAFFFISFMTIYYGAVSPTNELGSEEQAVLDGLEEFFVERAEEQAEFRAQYEGMSPEEVVQAMYDEILAENEDFEARRFMDPFAESFAARLNVNADHLNEIQRMRGTFGLQAVIEVMDKSEPGVQESLDLIHEYHDLRLYPEERFDGMNPEEILASYVNVYVDIYGPDTELNSYKQERVDLIVERTGFDELAVGQFVSHHTNYKSFFGLFPEDFPAREELMAL